MDIILAKSADFDIVISEESSEGKGDRHKEEHRRCDFNASSQ